MAEADYKSIYEYDYRRSPDQDAAPPARHPIVVIGAGPIGLASAIDLAQRGQRVVLLDDNNRIGEGSRAICFSKRALEACDRLGVGARMVDKGVTWQLGKVFLEAEKVYEFDLLPERGHKNPAFINLQQYYVEGYLVDRALGLDNLEIRWRNEVTGLAQAGDVVTLTIDTPDGPYDLEADYVIACDGARSPTRAIMGLDFVGQVFDDRFLIVDVKMKAEFPTERWFWFDPPFHKGQSALLHKQPDDVWRIDFQLGRDADPDEEKKPEKVLPRLKAMLGDVETDIEWVSVYTFQCMRMDAFVHGRVFFAGDAAHQVSPFGARGANSGFEDAQNLAWKLDAVLRGRAGPALLDTYAFEREMAADDNIGHSTRATDFISPKSAISRVFRTATLNLARSARFAQRFVNSGRLSTPSHYKDSPLGSADAEADDFTAIARINMPAPDAPLEDADGNKHWLLDELPAGFTALHVADGQVPLVPEGVTLLTIGDDLHDRAGLFAERYDGRPGTIYLIRPDQYVCARLRSPDGGALAAAHARALANL
jgi:3-(3-hydroxy-phenyl)propionate hydroxylase